MTAVTLAAFILPFQLKLLHSKECDTVHEFVGA